MGDTYTLSDGTKVPYSISYNNTTYLPIRKVGELVGLPVNYDGNSNTAILGKSTSSTQIAVTEKPVSLIKISDKYYITSYASHGTPLSCWSTDTGSEQLVFTNDISVNSTLNSCSWYMNAAIDYANMDYTITASDNPNVTGMVRTNSSFYSKAVGGQDGKVYTSATSYYLPTWVEYNGVKIYKLNEYQTGLYEVNGIRYYNNLICLNDLFKQWGIDKSITIGKYEGSNYMEIK